MSEAIRTRWHKLYDLIDANEVYLSAPPMGKSRHVSHYGGKAETYRLFLQSIEALPKFVIEDELLKLSADSEYQKSLCDMKEADCLRLPFPALVVELSYHEPISNKQMTNFVLLRDLQDADVKLPWERPGTRERNLGWDFYGTPIRIHEDQDGKYVVFAPGNVFLRIEKREDQPYVGFVAEPTGLLPQANDLDALLGATYQKDCGSTFAALSAALLLMATQGVKRTVIECEKLNRQRKASGKPAIPKHTYISIGKVYRSASSESADDYNPRKSPRPHMRRGHNRMIAFGKGRTERKPHYFPPKLVACYGMEPEAKTYMVRP